MKIFLKKSYRLFLIMLIIVIQALYIPKVQAESVSHSNLDTVFLLDSSGSMKESDPEEIRIEAIKMFLDMSEDSGNKFGLVAYSDNIVREHSLDAVNSKADKENIKNMINGIQLGQKTDTGMGLKEAVSLMDNGHESGHRPVIILLSDGKNDPARSEADSEKDLNSAIETAKSKGYKVYTIGLNYDGTVDKALLANIAESTGGKSYITSTAADLPKILTDIYADNSKVKVQDGGSITANGAFQDVKINIPNSDVAEANISMLSSKPLEIKLEDNKGKEVALPSQAAYVSTSKKYTLLKILKPEKGDWTLKVKGVNGDNIKVNFVYNYDLTVGTSISPTSIKKGDSINVSAYLMSNGQKVSDKSVYNGVNAKLIIKNLKDNSIKESNLTKNANNYTGKYKFDTQGNYEVSVKLDGNSFFRESNPVKVIVQNGVVTTSKASSTVKIIVIIIVLLIALALALFIINSIKKGRRKGFGRVMLEVRDESTGEVMSPKYKLLEGYTGKFSLYEVLGLKEEFAETENLYFKFGNECLILDNKSECIVKKSGRNIEKGENIEILNGDRIVAILNKVEKTISMEFYTD
ncbi:vWA domain-containing protein [Clostridium hydrogenum]|uniref:vWA domain-containing protein n=1 Tax=Clostridium hydrogenum TaxID=2855764 RepID=UPI001F2BF1C1|nr:vWA domain-containing protein [Clostridium hydrogenum]